MIKTVNIFSEKNSIILLNRSSCLLCCQLRIQCHNAELKANDVEVCFISMCMAGRFVEWKMIHPHRTKKAVTFGPFPKKKYKYANLSHGIPSAEKMIFFA